MDYEEWSARFVEKDFVMPPVVATIATSADGEDWREQLRLKKEAMQESLRWRSNTHLSSDPGTKPVSRLVWRQFENCWSPERLNYALVCAERGAVFAVGTPVHKREEKNGVEVFQRDPGSSLWWQFYPTMEARPVCQPSSIEGRYEHTCSYYNGKIFMYGGRCGQKKKLFQDMACYDIATANWSVLKTFLDGCAHPGRRCGHACTSNGSIMYIHGGRLTNEERYTDGACYTAKLVSFDMATLTWKEIIPTYRHRETNAFVGEAPPESWMHMLRDRHSIEYVGGRIIMFGGRGPATFMVSIPTDRPDHEYFHGFFELNLSTRKCGRMVTTGYSPEGRELVASARCGHTILYCGGFNCRRGCFADLFMLNADTHHVSLVSTSFGCGPGPRVSKMCAVGYSVLLLGGASKTTTVQCLRGGQYLADITESSVGHGDMYFLGSVPSLQQVCALTIVSEGLDYSMLPPRLQHIVSMETLP